MVINGYHIQGKPAAAAAFPLLHPKSYHVMSAILSPPRRPSNTAPPPTASEHYTALAALHTHYRALIAAERETMVRERALWDTERALYQRRIAELESAPQPQQGQTATPIASPPPAPKEWAPPSPPQTTTTAAAATTAEWAPPSLRPATRDWSRHESALAAWAPPPYLQPQPRQENTRPHQPQPPPPPPPPPPEDDAADDDDEEISPEEMQQLLREATRIVYPITQSRPRGRSLAEPAFAGVDPHGGAESEGEDDGSGDEEVVELKLRKTSNFGMDFGKWRY